MWIQKELAATGKKVTGVALRKLHFTRKNWTRDKVTKGTPKGQTFGKKCWPKPETIKGTRIQGLKKQLYMKSEGTPERIFGKTVGLEITKRTARSSVGL